MSSDIEIFFLLKQENQLIELEAIIKEFTKESPEISEVYSGLTQHAHDTCEEWRRSHPKQRDLALEEKVKAQEIFDEQIRFTFTQRVNCLIQGISSLSIKLFHKCFNFTYTTSNNIQLVNCIIQYESFTYI